MSDKSTAPSAQTWSTDTSNVETCDETKKLLSNLSLNVRGDQLKIFMELFNPNQNSRVLDVGVSPNELLADTNYFEKNYKYPESLTAASVEDVSELKTKYPKIAFQTIQPGKAFPFKDKEFDLVTAWATLEHVGSYQEQGFFLKECLRVGKSVFLTVPYRGCIYEPHAGVFFLHWLPLRFFRWVCTKMGKQFWASEQNLNPLYIRDIRKMLGANTVSHVSIKLYKMFGFLPSHLIISTQQKN